MEKLIEKHSATENWQTVDCIVEIHKLSTGEMKTVEHSECIDLNDPYFYLWEEGNYSCDCNRSIQFGDSETRGDYCSFNEYKIRIIDSKTNVEYYTELKMEKENTETKTETQKEVKTNESFQVVQCYGHTLIEIKDALPGALPMILQDAQEQHPNIPFVILNNGEIIDTDMPQEMIQDIHRKNQIEEKAEKKKEIEMFNGIGRNQKCPCGSGLKFKYCCITKTR